MSNVGIVVLAGGSSSRMSKSKQLLHFEGESLLRRSVRIATQVSVQVVAVLGADYLQHNRELNNLNAEVVFNLDWNKGMGNSLKFGLSYLHKSHPDLDAAIIMVCDQPYLSAENLWDLIKAFNRGNNIVASTYGDAVGVPALFDRQYFKEMMKIPDTKGAKLLLKKYAHCTVSFPEGATDIDTDEDWLQLKKEADKKAK